MITCGLGEVHMGEPSEGHSDFGLLALHWGV